jgi:hypothetical protein
MDTILPRGYDNSVVPGTHRMLRQDCEILLGQIDGRLATLRSRRSEADELAEAERTAAALRRLVADPVLALRYAGLGRPAQRPAVGPVARRRRTRGQRDPP